MDRARAACCEVQAGQLLVRLVEWLRRADERLPVSVVLAALGAGCVAAGLCCCAWTLVFQHPHLLVLALGLALLPLAALAHRGGLAGLLPDRLQYYLLMRTPFDLLVNEPAVRNKLRRWGRVLLLCQERSDEEIRTIIRNLDPAFMEMVFQRSIVDALPQVLRLLLLPAGGAEARLGPPCAGAPLRQAWRPAAAGCAAGGAGVGPLVASWRAHPGGGAGPRRGRPAGDLSVAGIRELMRRRADEKRRSGRAAEPALGPVFKAILRAGLGESGLVHNLQVQQSLRHASTVSVLLSGASGMFAWFCGTPRACGLLRSLLFRRHGGHQRASRVAAASAVLGLVGAGGWLVLALALHWQSRRAAALPPTRGEVRAVDPLEELVLMSEEGPPPARGAAAEPAPAARGAARPPEPESEVSPESSASEDETAALD